MIESAETRTEAKFFNEKIAKKLLKNEKLGKQFSARIISDTLGMDYQEVYDNITLSTEEIAFTALTIRFNLSSLTLTITSVYFDIYIQFICIINSISNRSYS